MIEPDADQRTTQPPPPAVGRAQVAAHAAAGRVRLGRSRDNDVVLDDLLVSRYHAELHQTRDGAVVVDLGSRNGTFHNGRQVDRAVLQPGDVVAIGRHELVFDGQQLREYVDTGPVSMSATGLSVTVGRQVLLSGVSFTLAQGSLVAVVGPSGCGKSTLIRAVTGLRPATTGTVTYAGRDLYAEYAQLRYRIGMVPQDDILHRQLTVRRAMRFAAALRFADDVPRGERDDRVDAVLATLGLTDRARHRIDRLSGGQRKRVSVAMELLTEPGLLCLDEPTSGLDPALDKEVMRQLRHLADRGRTVLVVTHNMLHLNMCDRVLVLCQGGTMGYFGPPDELLAFFQAEDYAEVFDQVTREPQRWTQRYRDSEQYRRYVAAFAPRAAVPQARPDSAVPATGPGATGPPATPPGATRPSGGPAGRQRSGAGGLTNPDSSLGGVPLRVRARHPLAGLRQLDTLCLRMLAVIIADRGYALFLLGLPLILALLANAVPGEFGLAGPPAEVPVSFEAQRLLVVLIVGAAFLGIAVSIREIVNESSIYRRERAVGLSAGAYLLSKVMILGAITIVQVALFVSLALAGRGKPDTALVLGAPLSEVIVAVTLVALTCTVLGLCISALARTTEQTTPVLVVAVMAQLVLSGGLFELGGEAVLAQVSWLAPTRWGYAATASTVDLTSMIPFQDALWGHTAGAWWRSVILLLTQMALLGFAGRLALRRLEPGRQ